MKPYLPSLISWYVMLAVFVGMEAFGAAAAAELYHRYTLAYHLILLLSLCCQFLSFFWGIIGVFSRPKQRGAFIATILLSVFSVIPLLMLIIAVPC